MIGAVLTAGAIAGPPPADAAELPGFTFDCSDLFEIDWDIAGEVGDTVAITMSGPCSFTTSGTNGVVEWGADNPETFPADNTVVTFTFVGKGTATLTSTIGTQPDINFSVTDFGEFTCSIDPPDNGNETVSGTVGDTFTVYINGTCDITSSTPGVVSWSSQGTDNPSRVTNNLLTVALATGGTTDLVAAWPDGGRSSLTVAVTSSLLTQTVSWAPSNTSVVATAGSVTPDALATPDGDGGISYSVGSAGTTGCTVNSSTGVVSFTAAGTCSVTATAAETATYAEGTKSVDFTITPAPAPGPAPAPSTAPDSALAAPTPKPTPTPTQESAQAPLPNSLLNPPNPAVRTRVGPPGVTLVADAEALSVPPRILVQPPSPRLRDAPRAEAKRDGRRVPVFRAGDDVRLLVALPVGGDVWTVRIRKQGAGGSYTTVGTVLTPLTDAIVDGRTSLPVFNFSRKGTYIVALTNADGEVRYVKIVVGRAQR